VHGLDAVAYKKGDRDKLEKEHALVDEGGFNRNDSMKGLFAKGTAKGSAYFEVATWAKLNPLEVDYRGLSTVGWLGYKLRQIPLSRIDEVMRKLLEYHMEEEDYRYLVIQIIEAWIKESETRRTEESDSSDKSEQRAEGSNSQPQRQNNQGMAFSWVSFGPQPLQIATPSNMESLDRLKENLEKYRYEYKKDPKFPSDSPNQPRSEPKSFYNSSSENVKNKRTEGTDSIQGDAHPIQSGNQKTVHINTNLSKMPSQEVGTTFQSLGLYKPPSRRQTGPSACTTNMQGRSRSQDAPATSFALGANKEAEKSVEETHVPQGQPKFKEENNETSTTVKKEAEESAEETHIPQLQQEIEENNKINIVNKEAEESAGETQIPQLQQEIEEENNKISTVNKEAEESAGETQVPQLQQEIEEENNNISTVNKEAEESAGETHSPQQQEIEEKNNKISSTVNKKAEESAGETHSPQRQEIEEENNKISTWSSISGRMRFTLHRGKDSGNQEPLQK